MKKIIILIPVYNDWQSLEKLIEDINLKVKNINCKFSIFVINDGSTEGYDDKRFSTEEIKVEVISLLKNVGHNVPQESPLIFSNFILKKTGLKS